jgi:hypothetical protein
MVKRCRSTFTRDIRRVLANCSGMSDWAAGYGPLADRKELCIRVEAEGAEKVKRDAPSHRRQSSRVGVLQRQADKEALSIAVTDMDVVVLERPPKQGHGCAVRYPHRSIGIRAFALVIAIKRHEGRRRTRAAL